MKQCIRIIGGKYRSKKLYFPDLTGLRPTPDRVRETLFNWLMHDIHNAHCLDAFAGSGALGFEAFSRGAAAVTLIESSPVAFASLQKNSLSFNSSILKVINLDARKFLKTMKEPVDIIFLDPPFASNCLLECLDIIIQGQSLRPGGLVYVESAQKMMLDQLLWSERKSRKAGQVYYALYEKLV
ncbi:methyltransferase [Legionella beliardensis]|uniref:Ribosomal RNA small subunit methyltransferase D n=1 Tax=Legionella beliardensis TaxID=91822 RepID=A0A378I3T8_9GAMM|nr:16S rRNA (guanine(966)-N(2))-methyltransferase RsmD [Legionella beliardensis]STX29839.1 methyltransferase [Legionella beliardensis]